jgi:hypothetical protein
VLRARAVEVTFQCSFERALELSLRKNARIHDDRIPSGTALGKIVRYVIRADGAGKLRGEVTMACAIGTGGTVAADPGTPTYVAEGYVDVDYQFYEDQTVVLGTSDVGYTVPRDDPNDDGLTFPLSNPFVSEPVISHVRILGNGSEADVGDIIPPLGGVLGVDMQEVINDYINSVEARMNFTLVPVAGSKFSTVYTIEATDLQIPAGINLGAL